MGIIESVAGLLIVLWLLGLGFHIAGSFIHILLVLAVIVFLLRFLRHEA